MTITSEKIERISSDGKQKGIDVRLRDVSYFVLAKVFGSPVLAYKVVFDQTAEQSVVQMYENGTVCLFVREWFKKDMNLDGISEDLTFTENKQALIDMLEEITDLAKKGEMQQKDAMRLKAEIRVKLNDKFQVQDSGADTVVVVPAKYDMICPHTHRECYQMKADYAKKTFHLVDDPTYDSK